MNGIFLCFFLQMIFYFSFKLSIDAIYEEFYDIGLVLFVLSLSILRVTFHIADILDSRNL